MTPKQILIKSLSNKLLNQLDMELSSIPSIRYNYKKINGIYTISIKCFNYYEYFCCAPSASFYGSYIYLYTNISLILSSLIISLYEPILVDRNINQNYFYFDFNEQTKIKEITNSILDPNYPTSVNLKLYMYRKGILLNSLINNFRKKNYLNVDSFINFSASDYTIEVESAVDKAVELYLCDMNYSDFLKMFFEKWFK